jgi:pimeloyl-ACP methyl ester carboxylesterase
MTAEAEVPQTRFALLGEDRIAFQAFGEGDVDVLYGPSSTEAMEVRWEWPPYAVFLRRLGAKARVIMFDRRGSGSSDDPSGEALPSRELWADEARIVLDTVESEKAVVLGTVDAGPTSIVFAAAHPTRTRGLILANTTARYAAAPDYPWGIPEEMLPLGTQVVQDTWEPKPLRISQCRTQYVTLRSDDG